MKLNNMQKKSIILSFVLLFAIILNVSAQYAHESLIKFEKNNVNAVIADYSRPKSVIEEALKAQLEKEGLVKSDKTKGYIVYKGANWNRLGKEKVDLYFKVDGSKSKASITILISKGYSNFINSETDPGIIKGAADFLNHLETKADEVQFSLDLSAQQFVIAKAEKENARSLSDSTDLAADRKKLDAKIVAQNEALQARKKALEAERLKLAGMKNGEK
jgi:hypothetical protein